MLAVQILATVLSFGFLGYGIHLVGESGRMERADESVLATLRRRLHFHRTKFEIWMWASQLIYRRVLQARFTRADLA
jgi:hypothetical protein